MINRFAPRRRRLEVVVGAVLAIGVLTVSFAPVAGAQVTPAASGNPPVIAGSFGGLRDVPGDGTYGTVAAMAVPAGRWFLSAKGYLQASLSMYLTCRLVAGADTHAMTTYLRQDMSGGAQWRSFSLMVTHRFTAPGTMRLQCNTIAETGDAIIRQIRMTAMGVGRLTTSVAGQPATTIGSGKPEVRAIRKDDAVQVSSGSSFQEVASLDLPAGLWWITAAVTVGGYQPGEYTCRLQTPVDFDEVTSANDGHTELAPMTLQVTHAYDALGSVRVVCRGSAPHYASNTSIVAVRAGHLVNRQVGGALYDSGSGTPVIISGFRDDGGTLGSTPTTVASVPVPAGSWLLFAKLYHGEADLQGLHAACTLVAGSAVDKVDVALAENQSSMMSLLGAHTFGSGGGSVRVVCHSKQPGFTAHVHWIKVTAIRARSLTQKQV